MSVSQKLKTVDDGYILCKQSFEDNSIIYDRRISTQRYAEKQTR